jgi:hypothetical protein
LEKSLGMMVLAMKDNINKEKNAEKENSLGQMDLFLPEIFMIIKFAVMV